MNVVHLRGAKKPALAPIPGTTTDFPQAGGAAGS
jgi:hypothetical protein